MTTPTSEDPYPPQHEMIQTEAPPPFEDMISFEITRQVELSQLTEEITKAVGRAVQVAQLGPERGFVPAEDNPATIAVSPGSIDRAKAEKAIKDHEPDFGFGVPEREREYAALQQRLIDNPDSEISDDEVKLAIRVLVQRGAAPQVGFDIPGV